MTVQSIENLTNVFNEHNLSEYQRLQFIEWHNHKPLKEIKQKLYYTLDLEKLLQISKQAAKDISDITTDVEKNESFRIPAKLNTINNVLIKETAFKIAAEVSLKENANKSVDTLAFLLEDKLKVFLDDVIAREKLKIKTKLKSVIKDI